MLFLIAALRAIIEMLLLSLLAQAVLHVLAGKKRFTNPIYQLFSLITRAPRNWAGKLLPVAASPKATAILCGLLLFTLWIGLALARKFI